MRAVLAVALVGLVGCATTPGEFGRYATSDDLPRKLDAYSRAANLKPLRGSVEDELRVWVHGYMSGEIEGYVVTGSNAIKCDATHDYEDGVVSIDPARCRRWLEVEGVLGALEDLAALDGKEWACEVEDGIEVLVEGVHDGCRFAFDVANPAVCTDPDSRTVANLLAKLAR